MKRNEKQNEESECVGVENVSRDGVIRSAGVKSTLAAPLSRTWRWTQWVFLRRGHSLSPNTRERAGCTDMGRKKQPELQRNGTFCMDKQVTKWKEDKWQGKDKGRAALVNTAGPDAAVGQWDAVASSLFQPQTQNAQWHQSVSSNQQQLQRRESSVCYVKFTTR